MDGHWLTPHSTSVNYLEWSPLVFPVLGSMAHGPFVPCRHLGQWLSPLPCNLWHMWDGVPNRGVIRHHLGNLKMVTERSFPFWNGDTEWCPMPLLCYRYIFDMFRIVTDWCPNDPLSITCLGWDYWQIPYGHSNTCLRWLLTDGTRPPPLFGMGLLAAAPWPPVTLCYPF